VNFTATSSMVTDSYKINTYFQEEEWDGQYLGSRLNSQVHMITLRTLNISCVTCWFYSFCQHSLISVFLILDLNTSIKKQQNSLTGDIKCAGGSSPILTVQWLRSMSQSPTTYYSVYKTE
jgi:hypothetical protein